MQAGFILGTLAIALSGLADRIRPSRIMVGCSIAGALFNTLFALTSTGLPSALVLRFIECAPRNLGLQAGE